MNKLQGFYELQQSGLPTVPWREFNENTKLDKNILWTIRSAVWQGDDLNLPRKVGVVADEAEEFALCLLKNHKKEIVVIYYPYFIAEKSGVLEVQDDKLIIEAAKDDLWNLVTYNKLDVNIMIHNETFCVSGNEHFFNEDEIQELIKYSNMIKRKYRNILLESKSVFLEWSFAFESDIEKHIVGNRKLVFFELRSVD